MTSKIVEIRDAGTFIPALAVKLGSELEQERWLLASSGFGRTAEDQAGYIVLCKINGGEPCACHIDPFAWGQNPRTMLVAHRWLQDHFDELIPGGVIDVEFILELRAQPKISDRFLRGEQSPLD